jgi:type II secretory pathway component PulF
VQRELEKVTDLRHQLITLANREEAAKNELLELKKKTEKSAAEFQQKLNTMQKEKMKLEDCIQDVGYCD